MRINNYDAHVFALYKNIDDELTQFTKSTFKVPSHSSMISLLFPNPNIASFTVKYPIQALSNDPQNIVTRWRNAHPHLDLDSPRFLCDGSYDYTRKLFTVNCNLMNENYRQLQSDLTQDELQEAQGLQNAMTKAIFRAFQSHLKTS